MVWSVRKTVTHMLKMVTVVKLWTSEKSAEVRKRHPKINFPVVKRPSKQNGHRDEHQNKVWK